MSRIFNNDIIVNRRGFGVESKFFFDLLIQK